MKIRRFVEKLIDSPIYKLPYFVIKAGENNKKTRSSFGYMGIFKYQNIRRNDWIILLGRCLM